MEPWQRQGFKSFGDWRRSSEKRRRDARRAAAAATAEPASSHPPACTTPVTADADQPQGPIQVVWQPLQTISSPPPQHVVQHDGWSVDRPSQVPLHNVHEQLQISPRGSRAHSIEHRSPRYGTTRIEKWISPPGVWKNSSRSARRAAAQLNLVRAMQPTRARHELEARARIAQERCGACVTCVAVRQGRTGTGFSIKNGAPCEQMHVPEDWDLNRVLLKVGRGVCS